MKRVTILMLAVSTILVLTACGGGKRSAASIAQEWCDLNAKVHKAEGTAKEEAEKTREKFEKDMEAKYEKDEAFMKEIGKEVEKCEDASEGRK